MAGISRHRGNRRQAWNTHKDTLLLAKLFFQILQCLHHIHVICSADGLPKAFKQKRKELNRFMKPAQELPGSTFRTNYQALISNFLQNSVDALEDHYLERLHTIKREVQDWASSNLDFEVACRIAAKWGRKTFGSKLNDKVLDSFSLTVARLQSENPYLDKPSPSQTSVYKTQNSPSHPPVPNPPKTNTQNSNQNCKPISNPKQPRLGCPTPLSYSSAVSGTAPFTPPPLPKTVTNCSYSPKTHSSNRTSTRLTKTEDSPVATIVQYPFTPPQPTQSSHNNRNVQGRSDPLSTLFECVLNIDQRKHRSLEHAYQFEKAFFLGDRKMVDEIQSAVEPKEAKHFGETLDKKHKGELKFQNWEMKKRATMKKLLWAKVEQSPLFRETLLQTKDVRLTHIVPNSKDRFWATTYVNNEGKTFQGQDVFAKLLMEIRRSLQDKEKSQLHETYERMTPHPPSQTPPSFLSPNRFYALKNESVGQPLN